MVSSGLKYWTLHDYVSHHCFFFKIVWLRSEEFSGTGVDFSLLPCARFRAGLRWRQSSSASADHHDSSAARDHRHEIPVCIFKSVSPVTTHCVTFVWLWQSGTRCVFVFLQSVPVQWREHDGSLQSGHLLWSHADANTRWTGPRVLPGPC